ncbi:MAG: hypothetical protein LUO86_01835 [Methanomicrobiales archaeon]|jgi:hypothetical protein|nr:hypothetical protein [Methanomicrobiales archaeon]MDD1654875.1 hypothetical protein [Methanomicrobiales archaeon]
MKREEEQKKIAFWSRVVLICIALLFVGIFVIGPLITPIIGTLRTVKPLETVAMQYTLRDANGQVILTTDKAVYQAAAKRGDPVFYTSTLDIQAGKTGNPAIIPVPAYNPNVGTVQFGLLGLEADEMAIALVGLRQGEKKSLTFGFEDPLQTNFSEEEFTTVGGNFSVAEVGDWFPLGFSTTPIVDLPDQNVPTDTAIRIAKVLEKTDTSILLGYRYATADVSFDEFTQ